MAQLLKYLTPIFWSCVNILSPGINDFVTFLLFQKVQHGLQFLMQYYVKILLLLRQLKIPWGVKGGNFFTTGKIVFN